MFLEGRSNFVRADVAAIFKPTLMEDGKEKDNIRVTRTAL